MLVLTIPKMEFYDESKEEFIQTDEQTLQLEHSLISMSKWESRWHKPFLSHEEKTDEETIDYVRCMTLNKGVDPYIYDKIPRTIMNQISDYIDDSMTATTFSGQSDSSSREIITSEIIYYWLIKMGIPFECQKWHLNRLLTLIRVYEIKESPKKKMGRNEILNKNRELNEARKAKFKTKG